MYFINIIIMKLANISKKILFKFLPTLDSFDLNGIVTGETENSK